MTSLNRFECDFCKSAYNDTPAETHTIDGEHVDLCGACEREFSRLSEFPEYARGAGYQYHGAYFPKTVEAEAVWQHLWWVQENHVDLADWIVFDRLLLGYHEHRRDSVTDEDDDRYQGVRSRIEKEVREDDSIRL